MLGFFMLSERSEFFASEAAKPSASHDYENITSGPRAQDVFKTFPFYAFLSSISYFGEFSLLNSGTISFIFFTVAISS